MVYLKEKIIKGSPYYYLVQSMRVNGKHKKIEHYIGKVKPSASTLEELKNRFLARFMKKHWLCLTEQTFSEIETIKKHREDKLSEEQLMDFCIDFTYNTNAIEGGALTKEETIKLIKEDLTSGKGFKDEIESFSHKRVFMEMIRNRKPLTLTLIKKWHKELFAQSKPEHAGIFREKNVRVAKFKAPHYLDIDHLLKEFISWYNKYKKKLHPVELAALTHLKFVKIHPFIDGNGRIARLLINYVLHVNKYPLMTVEHTNRRTYYAALDEFDDTQEEEVFVNYIIGSYIRENS